MTEQKIVIHRGSPRWFSIRGARYEIVGGPGPDGGNRGWGYEVWAEGGTPVEDGGGFWRLDDVRQWVQEWADHPEWGSP